MKAKSKKLSYVLRHQFSDEFLPGGWLAVDFALSEVGITMRELEIIVAENDKGRYELSYDKTLIRALYGHSVDIDLDYIPTAPPDILYHGTASTNYASILEKGIVSKNRQYVHLSEDIDTAISVGQRHGLPIALKIDTRKMAQDGCIFFNPKSGIWLTKYILPRYIEKMIDESD